MGAVADLPLDAPRTCKLCGEVRELRSFGVAYGPYRKHICNPCNWARRRAAEVGTHGLTRVERLRLIAEQNGCCACCGSRTRDLLVDHDHADGHIRGVICTPCNLMLGHAKDEPERLRCAARYLENN